MAGTSTGAIITAAIAMGMTAKEITQLYVTMGQKVFPPLTPRWLPKAAEQADEFERMARKPFLYSNEKLIDLLKKVIQDKMGNADLTLAELNERLGPDKVLILTTVNITARRTRLLKSHQQDSGDWKLWEAILASSSAPIALPVWSRADRAGKPAYYTDGGVGSYGNPAYVVAQEAIVFQGYAPEDVSVLSFGTGWVDAEDFERASGTPTSWHGLNWAMNAPLLLLDDAARNQSLEILEGLGGGNVDFRRFQFALENDISSDGYGDDATYAMMNKLGDESASAFAAISMRPTPIPNSILRACTICSWSFARPKMLADHAVRPHRVSSLDRMNEHERPMPFRSRSIHERAASDRRLDRVQYVT